MKTEAYTTKEKLFKEIYTKTFDSLNKIFLKALKSEELTNDVLQETYLKLWRKLDELDGRQDHMPFLYFHARNFARKEINSKLRKDELESELSLTDQLADIETELEKKEYRLIVNKVINDLPPKRRQVYRMFKEEGLSYKNIAQILHISNKTVDNHLNEATKTIKREVLSSYGLKSLILLAGTIVLPVDAWPDLLLFN